MIVQEKAAMLLNVDYEANSDILTMLFEVVADEILAYCNIEEIPTAQENTQVQMICHKYNARHSAGLSGASYSGIREDYRNKYTDDIYASLNRYRRVKCI